MRQLWKECVDAVGVKVAEEAFLEIQYGAGSQDSDLEEALSRCDSLLAVREVSAVKTFRDKAIERLVSLCSEPDNCDVELLAAHCQFLSRLARRR